MNFIELVHSAHCTPSIPCKDVVELEKVRGSSSTSNLREGSAQANHPELM